MARPRTPSRLALVVALTATTLLAACGGSEASGFKRVEATTTTLAPEVKAFYEWNEPIPNDPPGTVLRTQEIDAPKGAKAWRVLYVTRSAEDKPSLASGLVYAPTKAGRAEWSSISRHSGLALLPDTDSAP